MNSRRLIVSAFGIHSGGGAVLLKSLLGAGLDSTAYLLLDSRFEFVAQSARCAVSFVSNNIFSRFVAFVKLLLSAEKNDVVFCFNSLPPIFKVKGYVVVYVQARYLVASTELLSYDWRIRLRIKFERLWFSWGIRFCNEIWVQTGDMASDVERLNCRAKIQVVTLIDNILLESEKSHRDVDSFFDFCDVIFFYPANGVGHKNHKRLFLAWMQLDKIGIKCKLIVTLSTVEFNRALLSAGLSEVDCPSIINVGTISRERVFEIYGSCGAVIFPSFLETLGLPLLEAEHFGVPILAPELDYVREVCEPAETFDASSVQSISDAVRRFLGYKRSFGFHFVGPREFIARLESAGS